MARWLYRGLGVLCFSVLFSSLSVQIDENSLSVLYTVAGIMFSLGLIQIMSFSFAEVSNDKFVEMFRPQLRKVRVSFIVLFALSSFLFIFKNNRFSASLYFFKIDSLKVITVFQCFCLFYFIRNFLALQKMKDEIEDEIRRT